jgi:hypothetical protein
VLVAVVSDNVEALIIPRDLGLSCLGHAGTPTREMKGTLGVFGFVHDLADRDERHADETAGWVVVAVVLDCDHLPTLVGRSGIAGIWVIGAARILCKVEIARTRTGLHAICK